MSVCKYFLANSCRYGDRCRYIHSSPSDNYRSNPYVYDARSKSEGVSVMQRISQPKSTVSTPQPSYNNPYTYTNKNELDPLIPEYLKKVEEDVKQIEERHMWPLTCYSFLKQHGNFSGWNDISMEEVRWEAYQAQINNTTEMYLSNMQNLLSKAKQQRDIFIPPSKQAETFLRDYLKGNSYAGIGSPEKNVPFILGTSFNKPQASTFSFATALTSFDKPSQSSIFGNVSASTGTFSENIPQNNIFGTSSLSESVVNKMESTSTMDTGYSIFNQLSSQNTSGTSHSIFHSSSKFGQNGDTVASMNVGLYSAMEDLSPEDLEAFKAPTFTLENLPFALPPKELC